MQIVKNQNSDIWHNTSLRRSKPTYIIIHATADDGATAKNEVSFFNQKGNTRASADIFTDKTGIYYYNNFIESRYCWAIGGKKLATLGGSMHGVIKNNNSISIEMCCFKSGGNWCIDVDTYKNTIEVTKILMQKFGISVGNVFRHYDVTGKLCPCVYGFIAENGSEDTWKKFKKDISSASDQAQPQQKPVKKVTTKLAVDGLMGISTTKATQKFFGTSQDGIISGQYAGCIKNCPGISTMRAGHGGSDMVRALQRWLSVTADGSLGQQTIRAWQRKMHTQIDGRISRPSQLIKVWQKYLNGVL